MSSVAAPLPPLFQRGRAVLEKILAGIPAHFLAPILAVQHLGDASPGYLADLIGRRSRLTIRLAEDGDRLSSGTVYVAPPGPHLVVNRRACGLAAGARDSFARPSVDKLFVSAAATFCARTLAVVLTGRLFDGAAGAVAIRTAGSTVIGGARTAGRSTAAEIARAPAGRARSGAMAVTACGHESTARFS